MDTLNDVINGAQFNMTKMKCKNCGNDFSMRIKKEDIDEVSPILKKQFEIEYCDKCFREWYKNNKIDDVS